MVKRITRWSEAEIDFLKENINLSLEEKRKEMYLDYFNNFLTTQGFADYYGITCEEAKNIIEEFQEYKSIYIQMIGRATRRR